MAWVKAHIILDPSVGKDAEARSATLAKILQAANISQINQNRFDRYGILTGVIDDSVLEEIHRIPGVLSVEVDKERFLR
jgi:hypothetical protein